jgi:hypothetical protein
VTAGLIRETMHAAPFKAFDIKLVNGTVYHIPHPDYISVPPAPHAREIIVYLDTANGDGYGIRWVNLGLVIELIVQSVPAAENGGA